MRRGRLILAIAVVVIAGVALAGCGGGDGDDSASRQTTGLPTRTIRAGEVDVTVQPTRLDAQGATFKIVLDTHAVELSMDLARSARLEVADAAWEPAGWTGDGPGGHHRAGATCASPLPGQRREPSA